MQLDVIWVGTNLRVGVVDVQSGRVTHLQSIPTLAKEGHEAVITRMVNLINNMIQCCELNKSELCGVGIGVPGVLNPDKGLAIFLPNFHGGWRGIHLGKLISSRIGLSVHLINDVLAITIDEWKFAAGRGASSMVCFAIGTGIEGGVVINDNLVMPALERLVRVAMVGSILVAPCVVVTAY